MTQKIKLTGDDSENLQVTLISKHVDLTNPIKDYVLEKVHKIEKLQNHIIDMKVRLDIQKLDHYVDIVMKFSHFKIAVHASTKDMYASIDKAFERLKAKLRRWKGRIQDHHAKGVSAIDLKVNVLENLVDEVDEINDEIEEQTLQENEEQYTLPKVYKNKTRPLKSLNMEEAVMKMELSNDNFLIYRSEEDLGLKVLYRRLDSSYGIISVDKLQQEIS